MSSESTLKHVSGCEQLQLSEGEETATCPSCSLIVRVIYDYVRLSLPSVGLLDAVLQMDFEDYKEEDDAASIPAMPAPAVNAPVAVAA